MKDPAPTQTKKSKKVEIDMAPAWQKYLNAILVPVIIGLAVYLLVRWRMNANEAERINAQFKLTSLRSVVHNLRNVEFSVLSPENVATLRNSRYIDGDRLASELLASSKDATIRAEALVAKGDLNWQVANFPDLTNATTRPVASSPKSRDEMLKIAEAAYKDVLSNYASQPLAVNSARMGLAAIAQNRGQFDEADKLLAAVESDAAAPEAFKTQAKIQREVNKSIRTPYYIAPATQPAADIEATTRPATQASVDVATGFATASIVTQPATTRPTTQPAK